MGAMRHVWGLVPCRLSTGRQTHMRLLPVGQNIMLDKKICSCVSLKLLLSSFFGVIFSIYPHYGIMWHYY